MADVIAETSKQMVAPSAYTPKCVSIDCLLNSLFFSLSYRILLRNAPLKSKLAVKRTNRRSSRFVHGKRRISQTHSPIGQIKARIFSQIGSVREISNLPKLKEHQFKIKYSVGKRGAHSLPLELTILSAARPSSSNLQGKDAEKKD